MTDSDPPAETAAAVEELTPDMRGVWLVKTVGSQHVWNLDAATYTRLPGEGRAQWDADGRACPILTVGSWPRVGSRFYLHFLGPLGVEWRYSSTVQHIELLETQLEGDDD